MLLNYSFPQRKMTKPIVKFAATYDGKLHVEKKEQFEQHLKSFKGAKIWIAIGKFRKSKSRKAERYYWGGVLPTIADSTGHTTDELHEIFKDKFLTVRRLTWRGIEMKIPGSTKHIFSDEQSEFITKVIREAADMGIHVLTPDEYYSEEW